MKKDSYSKIIAAEIAEVIQPLMELEITIKKVDVTQKVVANHKDELLSSFANYCAFTTVYETVNRFFRENLNNGEQSKDVNNQLEFDAEGFGRVQKYYSIERDNELCAVSVNTLTEDEVEKITDQLTKNAKGLIEHARQLKTFFLKYVKSE